MTGTLQFVGAVAVALIGVFGIWLTQREGRKTSERSEASKDRETVMEAWRELLKPYREEVDRLHVQVDELNEKVDRLQSWRSKAATYIRELVASMRSHDLEPPIPPDGLTLDD